MWECNNRAESVQTTRKFDRITTSIRGSPCCRNKRQRRKSDPCRSHKSTSLLRCCLWYLYRQSHSVSSYCNGPPARMSRPWQSVGPATQPREYRAFRGAKDATMNLIFLKSLASCNALVIWSRLYQSDKPHHPRPPKSIMPAVAALTFPDARAAKPGTSQASLAGHQIRGLARASCGYSSGSKDTVFD